MHLLQRCHHAAVDRIGRVAAFFVRLTCGQADQQLEGLVHRLHRVDVPVPLGHGLHDVTAQHQVRDVGAGQEDPLGAGETAQRHTCVVEAFYLFIDPADGLDIAVLVDGAGKRQVLAQGQTGDGRDEHAQLGQ